MLFNSIDFAFFLPFCFIAYWIINTFYPKGRNVFLLVISYVFYGAWDWKFLILIFSSSVVDFVIGRKLFNTETSYKRRVLLIASLAFNLGLLGYFKYSNFFLESFVSGFEFFGSKFQLERLDVILPVGISFYTFQTLSYTLDIYKRKLEPTSDPISFFAFVGFFPQLVAGPIERASFLLPQFLKKTEFNYIEAASGVRQILWGFYKKVVIADNAALIVNSVYSGSQDMNSWDLAYGAIMFSFQIYGDFSGYSDIAIGVSKLFGFGLSDNFRYPYFSKNIVDFWSRWHITLTSWFRDYLYIPLGGNRHGIKIKYRNVLIVFLVSGLWHGANWTFVFWGLLNGIWYLFTMALIENPKLRFNLSKDLQKFISPVYLIINFSIVSIFWVFFRSPTISGAMDYLGGLLEFKGGRVSQNSWELNALIAFLVVVEWLSRKNKFGLDVARLPPYQRNLSYLTVLLLIFIFAIYGKNEFIYFQF